MESNLDEWYKNANWNLIYSWTGNLSRINLHIFKETECLYIGV